MEVGISNQQTQPYPNYGIPRLSPVIHYMLGQQSKELIRVYSWGYDYSHALALSSIVTHEYNAAVISSIPAQTNLYPFLRYPTSPLQGSYALYRIPASHPNLLDQLGSSKLPRAPSNPATVLSRKPPFRQDTRPSR
ncbi:hypothetical protein GMDG_01268 [Pseudogymnoascus destructans 20631-21]|uniref:Uncharacterized protein n=1 Tax=Pseudogymnoascus destructans (strain ATCC MYA-4855 / 20631-21) TaxID=658429 RepID=L8FRJ5_PSED2|nr:hypothetical protein GMDG_01268 [Pseudogymnoascus destructans 20631-21]